MRPLTTQPPGATRGRVLIVDDEPAIRLLIRSTLEDQGYELVEAADGEQALRLARSERPDTILLDIAIPRMSGLEVCRALRREPATATTPVLLLTGLDGDLAGASLAGAQGCISKPFSPSELTSRVADVMHDAGGQPASAAHPLSG
jgi:CheY-like chemotaxis protein